MPKPVQGSGRYMAGLDGLRALAVLAVIAYHLGLSWAPGGFLGVSVFFVLSGYLITDILIAQWNETGRFDLKDFWLRRARRLLPAMLIMLAAIMLWVAIFDATPRPSMHEEALMSVLYVNNWWNIYHEVSYFESFGPPSPLGHFWSLAVEEQFYLLWPLLLLFGLRFVPRPGRLAGLMLIGATASALAMAILFVPGNDPSRVYYGTDTRAFGLLFGAALAVVWPSRKLTSNVSTRSRRILDLLGGAGLLVVLLMIWKTDEFGAFLYQGGFVLLSLATLVVVATLVHPASKLNKWLGCKPLRWIGVRSYGIYLWHYPIIILTTPAVDAGEGHALRALLQVIASIGVAALSWRYLEEPIRRGALGNMWKRVQKRRSVRAVGTKWVAWGSVVLVVLIFCAFQSLPETTMTSGSSATSSQATKVEQLEQKLDDGQIKDGKAEDGQKEDGKQETGEKKDGQKESGQSEGGGGDSVKGTGTADPKPPGNSAEPEKKEETDPAKGAERMPEQITAIGDSILLDVEPYLKDIFPSHVIDGKIGRQMAEAQDVVNRLLADGKLGDYVIIELGTNGMFPKKTLESILSSIGSSRHILLVNTRVPRKWEETVNSTLAEVVAEHPNTKLIDWHKASAGKDGYFSADGVHLTPQGAQAFAALVVDAIKSSR
ncbi:acyltransferase family protein [Tumebacillus lipolyticus]|uniref:Acyltransferase family protein n=1 Tax=Tumebacillus lipolyticus TaxID=1280370 RepID=A0ABW5A2Z7_9BACL